MDNLPEWAGEQDEISEFDRADSADDTADEDPETLPEGEEKIAELPEEADPADVVEQTQEVLDDGEAERRDN
ncbi:hypothetical protein [Glycomyces buryatensis]|uniref:Uncharacterized protein n=1 Tax=Glycomyces buryatensis TaxID=2570927 RepID=A0A4S8Q9J1_9ACTN|nr:hypothetical protein [Glycomyces buryatensis]THV40900.1 hypothetical protein FAB82_13695 [Glycomyces buryatensis]